MASGKFRNVEHDRSLLDVGLHLNSVNKGFCGVMSLIDGASTCPCHVVKKRLVTISNMTNSINGDLSLRNVISFVAIACSWGCASD